MSKINAKFAFYKVELKNSYFSDFSKILEEIEKIKGIKLIKRINNKLYKEISFRKKDDNSYSAVFAKLRMDSLPNITDITTGITNPLVLQDSEGLSEQIALSYLKNLHIVSIQQNRNVMSHSTISLYIKSLIENADVEFIPIYSTDVYQRFLELETISSFEFKLVGMNDLSWLNGTNLSAEDKLKFQAFINDPSVDIKISKGKQKKASFKEKYFEFISALRNYWKNQDPEKLDKLKVKGIPADKNKTVILDLLLDRIIYECELESLNRTVSVEELMNKAEKSIQVKYNELKKYDT